MLRAKQLLRTIARQVLNHIRVLASTVVALARIALGVLVRKHSAGSFQHSARHEILARNHLQALMLALDFVLNLF